MAFAALIDKINALQQELASLQPLPADRQEKLDRKFRLEFNYNSNHIEGNTLTYGETELYLIFDKTTGDHDGREYEEMRASDAALRMIQEYAQDNERPLTENFIKSLHELILVRPYWADAITADGQATRRKIEVGQYKSQPNSVRLQNGEMFHYATPEDTPAKMGDLVQWYRDELEKKELHPVALAALLHYRFVLIHPFDDGNGRMSRLLMNYVLYVHGLPPVIVKSADKKNYLFALNKADTGDIDAFVEYIGAQMVWSLEVSIKAGKGESVEEDDDLDKEIEIFKRQALSSNPLNVIPKGEADLKQLYFDQLRPFIKSLEEKLKLFADLFNYYYLQSSCNRHFGTEYGLENVDTGIEDVISKSDLNSIDILLNLDGYKKNSQNPFNIRVEMFFSFSRFNYEIVINGPINTYSTKLAYTQTFSAEDLEYLTKKTVKDVLEHLKIKTSLAQ